MYTINEPVPFSGSAEQAIENYNSHVWCMLDEYECRCMACDSKPWHKAAFYPCGVEPPRHGVTYDT